MPPATLDASFHLTSLPPPPGLTPWAEIKRQVAALLRSENLGTMPAQLHASCLGSAHSDRRERETPHSLGVAQLAIFLLQPLQHNRGVAGFSGEALFENVGPRNPRLPQQLS